MDAVGLLLARSLGSRDSMRVYFLACLSVAVGLTVLLALGSFDERWGVRRSDFSLLAAAAWSAAVFFAGMYWMSLPSRRLSNEIGGYEEAGKHNRFLKDLIDTASNSRAEADEGASDEQSENVEKPKDTEGGNVRDEGPRYRLASLINQAGFQVSDIASVAAYAGAGDITRSRLISLAADLTRRSGLNLMAGIAFSGFGIAYLLFRGTSPYKLVDGVTLDLQLLNVASTYVPHAALVVLVELLAFFFLKLYRQTLDEIRSVHNELTNVEARMRALKEALRDGDKKMVAVCVRGLMSTERNFILKKGESTVDLERTRVESALSRDLLKALGGVLGRAGKGAGSSKADGHSSARDE